MSVKVSVLLPVNRDDGYLDAAVSSILNQTFKDFELLIIANNCTDELWSKIENIKELDARIKTFRLELGGLTFALNYGLNVAEGEYVARMDADDISLPERLEKQVVFLDKNISVVVLGTQIKYMDENNICKDILASNLPSDFNHLRKLSYFKCPIYHPTVMFRRTMILQIGGYKYGFYGEDYELWLRCIHQGYRISNLQDVLLKYRVHSSQVSSTSSNKNIYISKMLGIFQEFYGDKWYFIGKIVQLKIFQNIIMRTSNLKKSLFKK